MSDDGAMGIAQKALKLVSSTVFSTYTMPAAVSALWTLPVWKPNTVSVTGGFPFSKGALDRSPTDIFDLFSTARNSPGAVFYVNIATGADGNDGLTAGTALKSIYMAVQKANTANVPTKIIVKGGSYPRVNNPNAGAAFPTVDIAFIADGRVITGVWDEFTAPTLDATYTNTYSYTLTNVNMVCDRRNLNVDGNYIELTKVSTAALCNATQNSWALEGGKIYIRRTDGSPVTTTNTRVLRSGVSTLILTAQTNIFIGGLTSGDGFDFEGGAVGALGTNYPIAAVNPTAWKAVVACDSSFKYSGGAADVQGRAVSIDGLHGLALFSNCRADASITDGFNFHTAIGNGALLHAVTVNCSSRDVGGRGQISCNNWTSHEAIPGVDVCGSYKRANGGAVRSVNTGKCWFVRTYVADDRGDASAGGIVPPSAFNAEDTVEYFVDGAVVDMPSGGGYTFYTMSPGAIINYRNLLSRQGSGGLGITRAY
jgi:hypothetical protein